MEKIEFMSGRDHMTAELKSYGLSICGRGPRGGFAPGCCVRNEDLPRLAALISPHAAAVRRAALDLLNAFGGDTPDWLQHEAKALATACADFDGFPGVSPIRVLVALEGGLVQGAVADRPGVSVLTVDYDTEGADATEVRDIPQDGGDVAEGILGGVSCSFDPAFIDGAEAAELSDPARAARQLRATAKRMTGSGCQWRDEEAQRRYVAELIEQAEKIEAQLADEERFVTCECGADVDTDTFGECHACGRVA